jgi:hypothetical protein
MPPLAPRNAASFFSIRPLVDAIIWIPPTKKFAPAHSYFRFSAHVRIVHAMLCYAMLCYATASACSHEASVDAKRALNANHTASRTKLASHAQRANDVPVNFS